MVDGWANERTGRRVVCVHTRSPVYASRFPPGWQLHDWVFSRWSGLCKMEIKRDTHHLNRNRKAIDYKLCLVCLQGDLPPYRHGRQHHRCRINNSSSSSSGCRPTCWPSNGGRSMNNSRNDDTCAPPAVPIGDSANLLSRPVG